MAAMPPFVMALVFAPVGACALYALRQDLVAGFACHRNHRFTRQDSPLGYWLILAGKAWILVFCMAEILHAMNLCGDPVAWLRPLFG